jgi:hypothetical protein
LLQVIREFFRSKRAGGTRGKGRRHSSEQIVRKLREAGKLTGEDQTIAEAAKQLQISEQTFHWCRFMGVGMSYVEPGSPRKNPWVESFNGHARHESFAREEFKGIKVTSL